MPSRKHAIKNSDDSKHNESNRMNANEYRMLYGRRKIYQVASAQYIVYRRYLYFIIQLTKKRSFGWWKNVFLNIMGFNVDNGSCKTMSEKKYRIFQIFYSDENQDILKRVHHDEHLLIFHCIIFFPIRIEFIMFLYSNQNICYWYFCIFFMDPLNLAIRSIHHYLWF